MYDLGCICHLANTSVQYGLKKLSLPIEELLIDVYYHFFHRLNHLDLHFRNKPKLVKKNKEMSCLGSLLPLTTDPIIASKIKQPGQSESKQCQLSHILLCQVILWMKLY